MNIRVAICVYAALSMAVSAGEKADPLDSQYPVGRIRAVETHLNDILKLKLEGDCLAVNREHWAEAVNKGNKDKPKKNAIPGRFGNRIVGGNVVIQGNVFMMNRMGGGGNSLAQLFQRLRTAAGGQGMSMSSSAQGRTMSFNGGGLSVRLTQGAELFEASIQEEETPGLMVKVTERTRGLSILLVAPDPGSVLILRQGPKGEFSVKEMVGEKAGTHKAASFIEFCSRHDEYATGHLLPLLARAGISIPVGAPSDPRTIKSVLTAVKFSVDEKAQKEAAALIVQLDDSEYSKREAATKALTERFLECYPLLSETRKDKDLTPETKSRLETVFKNSKDKMEMVGAVYTFNRHKDPAFLVGMLDKVKGGDREIVIKALKRLTGKDFGDDAEAWRKHVESE
jgi:hypothetical protein